jgi:hypothetical protein
MTAQDVISFVRSIIISPVSGYLTDNEIISFINDGLKEFFKRKGIETVWSYQVKTGDQEIPFDNDVMRFVKIEFDNGSGKAFIDADDYEFFANTLYFATPFSTNGTLYAYGYRMPSLVQSPTDTVDIPPMWEGAIKHYVLSMAYMKDENLQASQYELTIFFKAQQDYWLQSRKINQRNQIIIEKTI